MLRAQGLLVLFFIAISSLYAQTNVTAIRAGTLIDPETGEAAKDQIILIEGSRISEIGPAVQIPPNARQIDLTTQVVLPGLMDAHTHLCASVDPKWDLGDFWIHALQRRAGYRAILGARHAKEMLEAGFTTVRDLGNAGEYLDMDLEKAIRFGMIPGPTIVAAGRIIAPFGGQFWDTPADPEHLVNPEYYFADSRDELRKAVRENIYWGAKVIKIVVDSQEYIYSIEDIRFVVEEAAAAGVKVAAHVQTEQGAHNAIEAGVASIEHAWYLTDEDMALAKQKGVVLVSTDFPEEHLLSA
jgi:imidazolonepropionase-like amidohydrolase